MAKIEAKQRGQRLIQIRNTLGLSRLKFCEKLGLANTTVAQWETLSGVSPGINERHARRIVQAVTSMGLIVTEEWLLYGTGEPPYQLKPAEKPPINLFHYACLQDNLQQIISQTLALLGPKFQAFQIPDDAMQPEFTIGDYIIGIIAEPDQWRTLFNQKPCLITLDSGATLVRIFREEPSGSNLLINTNPNASNTNQIITNAKITSIHQIVIHYRWGQM